MHRRTTSLSRMVHHEITVRLFATRPNNSASGLSDSNAHSLRLEIGEDWKWMRSNNNHHFATRDKARS